MERQVNISNGGIQEKFSNGSELKIRRLDLKPRPKPGSTAKHEAAHVVAAGNIVSATIIPSGEALGSTRPVVMTPESAAAAGAMGHDGCGWDRYLTERHLGVPWEAAKASARAVLAGKEDEIEEVATLLEERLTIGQYDVNEGALNVERKRAGIFPVEVIVTTPDGRTEITTSYSQQGEIKLQDDMLKIVSQKEAEEISAV